METQRPVAPLMGNKRTAADNSRWTDYRKKVKAWNRARFPRETLEQRRAREASERVAEFRKALQSLANDYHYANLPREMIETLWTGSAYGKTDATIAWPAS
jgi:transcription initiation factor TFIIIB Brf1 subunit/transcription initiation factor TFIIB